MQARHNQLWAWPLAALAVIAFLVLSVAEVPSGQAYHSPLAALSSALLDILPVPAAGWHVVSELLTPTLDRVSGELSSRAPPA